MLPSNLPQLLRAAGLTVVEVEGWRTRTRPGSFAPVGVLNHHTGSSAKGWSRSTELKYAKWMFLTGRSDLPAPLCQLSLGRSGVVYVGAAGRANHAGTAKASGSVGAGDGNKLYIGIEWMLSGTEAIPPSMYEAGMKLNAVLTEKVTKTSVNAISCHYNTSVTGKWDIGDPNGVAYKGTRVLDVPLFRTRVKAERERLYRPAKPVPAPKPPGKDRLIRIGHASMQFSDKPAEQRADVVKVLSQGFDILTWTEAASSTRLYKQFKEIGPKKGYAVFAHPSGVGIAVKKGWGRIRKTGFDLAAKGVVGQYSNRGLAWAELTSGGETITQGAFHYVTKGQTPNQGLRYRINEKFASIIGKRAKLAGAGRKLFFANGDTNRIDKTTDVFSGAPLTTCWDELKKWPPTTGDKANIDVIASYDGDGRVSCKSARAYTDKDLFLFTDHFLIEATYLLKG